MNRRESIEKLFERNFADYRESKIVIYGTGQYAEWIVSNFSMFNIVGVLDRWFSCGTWLNKPILSYQDVLEKRVKIIIIAANIYNTQTIFKRIEGFCNDNGIKLFSLEGELLNEPYEVNDSVVLSPRFLDCQKALKSDMDKAYWKLIEKRFFGNLDCVDRLGRLVVKTAYDIGYLYLGPIITDFMLWLLNEIKIKESSKIIFSARDGYLIQKLYRYLSGKEYFGELPQSTYLLTSRYVCMLSSLYDKSDIIDCAKLNFSGKADLMLKQRFLLSSDEIKTQLKYNGLEPIEYILLHEDIILSKAKVFRENYIKYLSMTDIGEGNNIMFFDLAASGTCQKNIEKLTDRQFIGTYLLRMPSEDLEKRKLNVCSYHEFNEEFATHSMFMESIITSFQPTLLYLDENSHPVFSKETRSKEELQFIREAQNGIFDYFTFFIEQYIKDNRKYSSSIIPDLIFSHVTSHYSIIDNEVFSSYVVKDEIFNECNSIANKCMV